MNFAHIRMCSVHAVSKSSKSDKPTFCHIEMSQSTNAKETDFDSFHYSNDICPFTWTEIIALYNCVFHTLPLMFHCCTSLVNVCKANLSYATFTNSSHCSLLQQSWRAHFVCDCDRHPTYGLFTLHGNWTGTGTGNWTSIIRNNMGPGYFPYLGLVWIFLYSMLGPISLIPIPCTSSRRIPV